MNNYLIISLLLFMIITTTTFEKNRFSVSTGKNVDHVKKNGRTSWEHKIKYRGHTTKKYPEIPLAKINSLNQVTNVSELLKKYVPNSDNVYAVITIETTNDNQNSTIIPKSATCTIENRTVSLTDDDNPSLYYSPPCTRVKRCGGCCGSTLVSCQPTKIEMLNFEVTILQYESNGTFTVKEKKIVTVEQHLKCKCDCSVKEQNCGPSQIYNVNECRCECNNFKDQDMCDEELETKMWDSETCSCRCIEEQECTTGFNFNYNTCRCELDDKI